MLPLPALCHSAPPLSFALQCRSRYLPLITTNMIPRSNDLESKLCKIPRQLEVLQHGLRLRVYCKLTTTSRCRLPVSDGATGSDKALRREASPIECVDSSQPLQDGEVDLWPTSACTTQTQSIPANRDCRVPVDSSAGPGLCGAPLRRARLVRRVPPSEKSDHLTLAPPAPTPRCFNLVRRVTTAPCKKNSVADLQRRQRRAREKAAEIVRRLRTLSAATAQLQRKHRRLRAFIAQNKENEIY
ncbi:hypothetical protein C8R46DRAFT_1105748 [Mycena filopes]|nr:hypothetical protein C8R46DRAFT_1105748 [Mycena filopes]